MAACSIPEPRGFVVAPPMCYSGPSFDCIPHSTGSTSLTNVLTFGAKNTTNNNDYIRVSTDFVGPLIILYII